MSRRWKACPRCGGNGRTTKRRSYWIDKRCGTCGSEEPGTRRYVDDPFLNAGTLCPDPFHPRPPKSAEERIREALKEAHRVCRNSQQGEAYCSFPRPCSWMGHAAINRLARAAFLAGQQHRQDEMNEIDAGLRAAFHHKPEPDWLPKPEEA